MTRAHVTLLGPCYKTGRVDSLPLHHRLWALSKHHARNRTPNDTEPSPGLHLQATRQPDPEPPAQQARTQAQQAAVSDVPHRTDAVSYYTRSTRSATGYLPSRPSKTARTLQGRFNRISQTATPVVVITLRKCTDEQVR